MFRKKPSPGIEQTRPIDRVTSVLGPGINWKGSLRGSGGIRIEGAFEGDITIRGLVVVGETGRVSCENITANTVVVAGVVNGNISTERLEIRSTGRVWGDVITVVFSTEDGAFLRGQVRMEDEIDLGLAPLVQSDSPEDEILQPEDGD
jgi:cytoskeletal protein CcmA (bactofilin family)